MNETIGLLLMLAICIFAFIFLIYSLFDLHRMNKRHKEFHEASMKWLEERMNE